MHFLAQLPDFAPLKNGIYRVRAQTDYHQPADRGTSYSLVSRGVADQFP